MSDNIKVVVKVRPLIPREVEEKLSCQWRVKNNTLYQLDQNGKESGQCFTFDKVYDKDTKTSDVYEDIAKPIVESATVGINGTIFAYGQTSSGKTYTMTGTEESPGIIPLSVYNLFDKIKTIPDRDFLLRVSYIEIYNDKIIDLLSVENENIKVHETVEGVKINATEKVITNPEELLDYMKEGDANRQIGTTNMNEKSSRSHSIFQITIESREHAEDEAEAEIGCVNVSQLNLVDLAGSERAAQTGATGSRFKEGTFINKSLSVLGLVIKQLSEDNKFINYRDCKLTRILQNSLGGNAKTSIICAVTPAAMEETLSTLQFANRAKAIKNKPEVNAVSTNATMIQKLTKQLAKLQYELESKRYLEQDNILLTMKIDSLQRQILNSFNQKSQSDILAKNRRKTWCAPRRATVSTLHPIQEDQQDISNVQGFSTPVVSHSTHKQFLVPTDAFKCLNRSSQVDRFSSMSNISEESMPSSKKHDTRVSETIEIESDEEENTTQPCSPYHKCYRTSKTPPCILRDKAKKAEKMYQDIIDFTEREKVYPPAVVEYMKRLDQHQSVISNLEDRVSTLSEECREKHNVIKLLEEKVIESDTQIRSITSNKKKLEEMCQEFNTKLIDLEVSYETLQKKAKSREKELLILLEEQKTKLSKCTENLLEKDGCKKDISNFVNMSKAILLINSDSETSINDLKNDVDGESQIQLLVTQLQEQLSHKSKEIIKLQEEIEHKNKRILSLENFNEEVEDKVTSSNHKIANLEAENSVLKSSIETLKSTIENQKICIDDLHSNAQSYNDLIESLQIELDDNNQIKTQIEQVDDAKSELMFSNENKLYENTEYIKKVIQKLKNLICLQKQEINELIMKVDSISTDKDHNTAELHAEIADKEKQIINLNEELLNFKHETDRSIIEINRLTQENSNLLKTKQTVLKQSSDIELHCENLKTEMKTVVNQKNVEINNLIADLRKANLKIDELTHEKTLMDEKNKQLMSELKTLESKIKDFENDNKDVNQKQYYVGKSKEIITKIHEILILLNGSFDENLEIDNVEESYRVFSEYIDMIQSLTKNMKSQNIIVIDNNNKLKTELLETKENHTIQLSEAIDKIKELLSVISDRPFDENVETVDEEGVFNIFKKYIEMLRPLVTDIKSQNETALRATMELKEKHQSEIQSLKSHLNLIQNEKTITENRNASLIKQYGDLLVDLKSAQSNIIIKDQTNTELINKINTLGEVNASLESKLVSCNSEITVFKSNELQFKSHIADIENEIIKKSECKQDAYLEQFETTLKLVQENFSQKLEMIQQLVFEKGNKISEITDNLHITINSLGNKRSEMKRQIHALQSTLAESEKTLDEVTNKLKWFADLLYIDFIPFNICEDNNKNKGIYSSIPQFLAEVYSIVKTWKEERNDSSNIKEKLIHLQSNYNALLQNFDEINDKYKLSLIEIEEIKLENTDLNNNLLQKSKEFESQKIEIESLYSNIQQLINQVKSLQDYNMNMQSKYLGCEDNFANVKNKVNKNTVLTNTDVLENNARSDISEFVSQSSSFQLNCPRTLISICCIKIAELLSNNELNITEKPSTFSSDLQTESRTLEPPDKSSFTCSCNDCLHALEMLHDNNQMKKEIQKLELLRQNLIVERDQYKEEIVSLINLTTELHKKIINHRTNLSTLTATTYAENKLLKSQVKVLQHHLKRFHDVCQIGFPSIKTQLSQLLTVLQTDPNYFKLPIFCIDEPEKESITSDKKSTQVLPHFDTTIESDLLMLDTNVTFASDSTLIENNQTDLDLSQTLCLNNLETLFNESKENCKLNTQSSINQTKVSYTEVQCNDTITSPNLESLCKWECNFNELKTLLNAKNAEFEKLQVKLVEMKDEKDELEEKLNLLSEPLSIEATKKMKNLEQDCLLKTDEVKKLQNSLQQKNEELKQLQEEVDNLSTEVMDNISEVDSLRTQLDSFQVSNSELTQKCLKLETILAEKENLSHGKKEISVCRECIIKDEIIQKLESSQLHAENNLGKAMETDSERYNKIEEINKNLQNELDASKEDCQKINEEVATIKSHLEKSNLSTASNINLDDAHVFNITKNLRSPERRPLSKLTLTMPDIDEEITSIDLYVCEKMECWNFYAEEMGLEKENLNHDIKIIDIMRMLYNGLLVKHGNEVENLLNKLRDFETSKALLKEKFDQLSLDYDKITQELEDKNKMLKLLSDRSLLLNKIIKEFQENLMSSENCAELVSQFKDKVLNMVDIELSTSTVNVFEKLIDNIANKQEKDLTNIMSKYTQLKDHMEKLVVEQNNLNENLVLMKNQLADKESKYNTLKMQKERIHEINNAVTLDIIKKEQELNSIVVDGWRKLVSHDIIKAEHNYGALPLGTSVQKLFENCIHMHQKFKAIQNNTKYESEIENLKTEIANMKYLLEDKAREYESLRSSFDTVQEINKTISSELQIKEEEFRKLMLLHEEVSQKCQSQSIELISNSSKVDNLNRDISALKELLGCQESTIKTLEVQIQTCEMEKRVAVEQELKFSTMLKEIQNLQHESSELKAANNAITKEKEYYSIELEKSKTVIKEQNEELSKISAQISVLNEVLNEKIKNIENLQGVGKIVLKENDNLRKECAALTKKINEVSQQHEEKENEYKRLETNLKTHEKTAEIQNNIIKKLQKQKENDQATINEKVKSLGEKDTLIEQLNERYTELLKKYELILQQLREKRNNRDCINSDREVIEGCLKGLENEMEGLRSGRNSLEADARRRRRSLHDAHRAMNNQNKEEEVFMAVLDSVDQNLTEFAVIVSNNSNSSGVMRPSSRRESGCERHEKCPITEKDDSNGRLSDVTDAARRRRQSVHDLRRSVRSPLTLNETLNHIETKHIEHQLPEEIQRELRELRDEVEMLRERCNELDEECDQCAEAVRDRERDIVQLTKENEMLETKLEELSRKLKNSESSFVEVAVNTDEDWSNLHAVVVDRMSYDAVLEKNRKLTRAHEELQRRARELRAALTAARDDSELKTIKDEFEACRLKYESLKVQYKALQVENITIAKRLHDLEDILKKEDDKENRIVESTRHKRRTIHDQNRPHDHDSKEEHLIEIQQLREDPEGQRRVSTLTVATGSAIVQSQQFSDVMKENHKLKKLVNYLRKKAKKALDEDEEISKP